MSWRSGSELPDGEIKCLCKYKVSERLIEYVILDSRPDGRTYKWINDDSYYYTQEEIIAWCPLNEIDQLLSDGPGWIWMEK